MTRRAAALACVLALAAAGCDEEAADPPAGATTEATLVDRDGDGTLEPGPGEPLPDGGRVLGAVAQVTDAHVRDEESPARLPVLDRLGEPVESAFRPHESLSAHVLAATVRSLNRLELDGVVVSGDVVDSAQANEVEQALAVLDGGRVRPDSGRRGYDGIQDASNPDPLIYRPDLDAPRHPGLLDRAQQPFASPGLRAPWHPALGNHDLLVAGLIEPDARLRRAAAGRRAVVALPPDVDPETLDREAAIDAIIDGRLGRTQDVPADPRRRHVTPEELSARLARSGAGRTAREAARAGGRLDYAFDAGPRLRGIVLDTVAREGPSGGVLEDGQRAWLQDELARAGGRRVLVFSHHPLEDTAGGDAVLELIEATPAVAAVVSGHTHRHRIRRPGRVWRISTAAVVDFPQQARVLRLVRTRDGSEALETFVVDHDGDAEAGVARELAFLDAQGGRPQGYAGARTDRNRRLPLR